MCVIQNMCLADIYKGREVFSEDEMRRPTLNAVPYGLQTLYGLLRPGRRIGPQ
jgi:hypothetical protein